MKKIVKILLKIFIVIACFVGLLILITRGLSKEVSSFFALLNENKIEAAYESTSTIFKESVELSVFQNIMTELSYDKVVDTFWSSRYISSGNQGKLKGKVISKNGSSFPVEILLVKESGEWKISLIKDNRIENLLREVENLPSDEEILTLIEDTLLILLKDIKKDDYSESYNAIARIWKSQQSREDFNSQLNSSLETLEIDESLISKDDPILTMKPNISRQNNLSILELQGQYLSEGLDFDLTYIYEYPDWKLSNLKLNWLLPQNIDSISNTGALLEN